MKKLALILILCLLASPVFALEKNVSGQHWSFFCFDETDNTPATSEATSGFTVTVYIDGVSESVPYTHIAELAGGYYDFTPTTAATNGDYANLYVQCATANIQCIGAPPGVWTSPANWNAYSISSGGAGEMASAEKAAISTITTMDGKIDTIDGIVDNILLYTDGDGSDGIDADIAAINTLAQANNDSLTNVEADTDELQTNQGDWATATGFSTHSAADVVNEWETQSQADPTGFHVNVKEVNGTAQTANDNGADINAIKTKVDRMRK